MTFIGAEEDKNKEKEVKEKRVNIFTINDR